MLRKISKILLAIYVILLVAILFTSSENIGFLILSITGIFTFVTCLFVTNDLKKLKNSLKSRITSVVLVSVLLYFTVLLAYGFSDIGLGDKGLLFLLFIMGYLILLIASLVINITITIQNKKFVHGGRINGILSILLIIVLIVLLYTSFISLIAGATSNQNVCSLHIETKDNSFIFQKGVKDYCLTNIAIKLHDPQICITEGCIRLVASRNLDLSICNLVEDYSGCISIVALKLTQEDTKISPEICDALDEQEARNTCLETFSSKLNDVDFCITGNLFLNCYDQLANVQNNGDESQCDPLQPQAKEECIQYVHSITVETSTT